MMFDKRQCPAVLLLFISIICMIVGSITDYDNNEIGIRNVEGSNFGISDLNVIMNSSESDKLVRLQVTLD